MRDFWEHETAERYVLDQLVNMERMFIVKEEHVDMYYVFDSFDSFLKYLYRYYEDVLLGSGIKVDLSDIVSFHYVTQYIKDEPEVDRVILEERNFELKRMDRVAIMKSDVSEFDPIYFSDEVTGIDVVKEKLDVVCDEDGVVLRVWHV